MSPTDWTFIVCFIFLIIKFKTALVNYFPTKMSIKENLTDLCIKMARMLIRWSVLQHRARSGAVRSAQLPMPSAGCWNERPSYPWDPPSPPLPNPAPAPSCRPDPGQMLPQMTSLRERAETNALQSRKTLTIKKIIKIHTTIQHDLGHFQISSINTTKYTLDGHGVATTNHSLRIRPSIYLLILVFSPSLLLSDSTEHDCGYSG